MLPLCCQVQITEFQDNTPDPCIPCGEKYGKGKVLGFDVRGCGGGSDAPTLPFFEVQCSLCIFVQLCSVQFFTCGSRRIDLTAIFWGFDLLSCYPVSRAQVVRWVGSSMQLIMAVWWMSTPRENLDPTLRTTWARDAVIHTVGGMQPLTHCGCSTCLVKLWVGGGWQPSTYCKAERPPRCGAQQV